MAIEIQGQHPTTPLGKRWQVEFWAWRPIEALIGRLCSDLCDQKTLENMAFGQGAGVPAAETCLEMACRFERWLAEHPDGFVLETGIRSTSDGRILTEQELADNPSLETVSPYAASAAQIERWIEFLKHCGGFEVW